MYKWLHTVLCIFAVTPHAGVRIEIDYTGYITQQLESPPTRGCELKLNVFNLFIFFLSHPPRGGAN